MTTGNSLRSSPDCDTFPPRCGFYSITHPWLVDSHTSGNAGPTYLIELGTWVDELHLGQRNTHWTSNNRYSLYFKSGITVKHNFWHATAETSNDAQRGTFISSKFCYTALSISKYPVMLTKRTSSTDWQNKEHTLRTRQPRHPRHGRLNDHTKIHRPMIESFVWFVCTDHWGRNRETASGHHLPQSEKSKSITLDYQRGGSAHLTALVMIKSRQYFIEDTPCIFWTMVKQSFYGRNNPPIILST